MLRGFLSILVILFSFQGTRAQCFSKNTSFKFGEKIVYDVAYNWQFVWLSAGEVTFMVKNTNYLGNTVYHFDAYGTSYKSYDWFYKVRDRYQAYADTGTLQTLWAGRATYEGGYEVFEDYLFKWSQKVVYGTTKTTKKPYLHSDTISLNVCLNDLVTAIYYARNIDFTKCKMNEKIPIWSLIVGKTYPLYIRFLGKEILHTRDEKNISCYKFSAKLVDGTVFKGGEELYAWVTDDENHIAVQVEAKILIGSIKATLKSYENLRNPYTSLKN